MLSVNEWQQNSKNAFLPIVSFFRKVFNFFDLSFLDMLIVRPYGIHRKIGELKATVNFEKVFNFDHFLMKFS